MGKKGRPLTEEQTRERDLKKAEGKAKKAAKRAIVREARAKGQRPVEEGWSKGIQKGEYGQDIFDGKVHAKWPSMFKKHLGILEAHIKSYSSLPT
jgi:flagellar biosynthesis/type III secretory pathway protein FliH